MKEYKERKPETKVSILNSVQIEPIQKPKERTVRLKYKSCCGCGCDYVDIERTVPFDSNLVDGDVVTNSHKSDKVL